MSIEEEKQEPDGHFLDFAYADSTAEVYVYDQFQKGEQFYKSPPQRQWVGLTDEEIDAAWESCDYTVPWSQHRMDIAYAIEAKLKEKNT